jgi:glycosyltransferase 2 family protein
MWSYHITMKKYWNVAKYIFAVAIAISVTFYFYKIFRDPAFTQVNWNLRWPELCLAGLLYLSAHTIWGTFWWQLLRSQGANVTWFQGVRAYFISQLGKYVPGKIWVIVMRVSLLNGLVSRPVIAVTGIYETLTSMSSGAALGALLFPYLTGGKQIIGGAWPLIGLAFVPIIAGLLNPLVNKLINRKRDPNSPALPSPSILLLAVGLLQAAVGWCLLGLSFHLIVRGVVPEPQELTLQTYLQELAVTTIMYVAGFVVLFAPGGVGARELILQQAMTPVLRISAGDAAPGLAAVLAIVVRLVWTIVELACIACLWLTKRRG